MRVGVASGLAWTPSTPTKILESSDVVSTNGVFYRNHDIAPDGQRFVMMKTAASDAGAPAQIDVVQHFDEELKRLANMPFAEGSRLGAYEIASPRRGGHGRETM